MDVDDQKVISTIIGLVGAHLPRGALIRRRAGSPRLALIYRAAEGEPRKCVVSGPTGKIEVLGHGQQVVVHGFHPSGAAITWMKGRDPDTVHRDQLPTVTEEQITAFLNGFPLALGVVTKCCQAKSPATQCIFAAVRDQPMRDRLQETQPTLRAKHAAKRVRGRSHNGTKSRSKHLGLAKWWPTGTKTNEDAIWSAPLELDRIMRRF
jgi:hypothetical protein